MWECLHSDWKSISGWYISKLTAMMVRVCGHRRISLGSGGAPPPPRGQGKPSFRANKLHFQGKRSSGLPKIHRRKSKICQFYWPEASSGSALLALRMHFQGKFWLAPPRHDLVRYAYVCDALIRTRGGYFEKSKI